MPVPENIKKIMADKDQINMLVAAFEAKQIDAEQLAYASSSVGAFHMIIDRNLHHWATEVRVGGESAIYARYLKGFAEQTEELKKQLVDYRIPEDLATQVAESMRTGYARSTGAGEKAVSGRG